MRATILVLAMAGCAGGASDAILEDPPDAADLEALLSDLEAELEEAVPEEARDALAAYVADPVEPDTTDTGVTWHLPADDADTWRMIGVRAALEGQGSTALWAFLQAHEAAPGEALPLGQLGAMLVHQDRGDEAKPVLLAALDRDDEDPMVRTELGVLYHRLDDPKRAVHHLTMAVGAYPQSTWTRLALASALVDADKPDLAALQLDLALIYAPDDPDLLAARDALPDPQWSVGTPLATPMAAPPTYASLDAQIAEERREIDERLDEELDRIGVATDEIVAERLVRQGLNVNDALACNSACSDDACREDCADALCAAEYEAHAIMRLDLMGNAPEVDAAYAVWSGNLQLVVWDAISDWRSRLTKEEIDELEVEVDGELARAALMVQLAYEGQEAGIAIDYQQVVLTCSDSTVEIPDLDVGWAFDPDLDVDFDLCLDGVLCIGLNNGELTLSASASWLSFEASYDMKDGSLGFEAGVGLKGPLRLTSVSAGFKFNTSKGVGVTGEVKLGPVVKVKAQRDVYLIHFDAD